MNFDDNYEPVWYAPKNNDIEPSTRIEYYKHVLVYELCSVSPRFGTYVAKCIGVDISSTNYRFDTIMHVHGDEILTHTKKVMDKMFKRQEAMKEDAEDNGN